MSYISVGNNCSLKKKRNLETTVGVVETDERACSI